MSIPSDMPVPEPAVPVRPLPLRPSLEFERKAARKLLRQLQSNDPAALNRVRPPVTAPAAFRLSDAQFIIAREYGFASWPKLVAYYATWDRHNRAQPVRATYGQSHYDDEVRRAMESHAARFWSVAPGLAAYVPRCYGKSDEEIFATPLTLAEAQLMVARREGFASWPALMAAAAKVSPQESRAFQDTPFGRAQAAIAAGEFATVREIVAAHPELVRPAVSGLAVGSSILGAAVRHERLTRTPAARELTDWLAAEGGDLQDVLNRSLIGHMRATREDFEFLIARGADVNWVPENGISILEHVLLRCWNPGPADVIAGYVKPRKAFWIAAGMNDVVSMKRYFSRDGTLTEAAHNDRPDFTAVRVPMLSRPGVDDRDILWEASIVAGFNHRWAALDFLFERGLPIDYSPWRFNLLHWAVGNRIVPVVERLVKIGASVDVRGWHPHASAREMAASNLESQPMDPDVRRVFEICCG